MTQMKTCKGCGESLPKDQFSPGKARCRPCMVVYNRTLPKRKSDPAEKRLGKARENVRKWTKEQQEIEHWLSDTEPSLRSKLSPYSMEEIYLDQEKQEKEKRLGVVLENIRRKMQEYDGDLRTPAEKRRGDEFSLVARPQRTGQWLEDLIDREVANWNLEGADKLTPEQQLEAILIERFHREQEEDKEASEHEHQTRHRAGLRAVERARISGRQSSAETYRRAYSDALPQVCEIPWKDPFFRWPDQWVEEAKAAVAANS
ncbi:MAG: hypothetical protein AAGA44_12140 [Pseudomonadota bacterium]